MGLLEISQNENKENNSHFDRQHTTAEEFSEKRNSLIPMGYPLAIPIGSGMVIAVHVP